MRDNLLIIFVKNLVPGNVKTRLAGEIGIEGALDVYQYLVEHTCEITQKLDVDKAVYYSEYVEIEDIWDTDVYQLFVQKGNNLGERMLNAFDKAFEHKYKKVVIIGSDCYELKGHTILKAFEELEEHDVVIGPAKDGGYYLLGLKKPFPQLFENKEYSHGRVFDELLEEVTKDKLSYSLLPVLNDIDTLEDLKDSKINFRFVDPDDEEGF